MLVPASILQDLRWWQYVMTMFNGTKSIYLDVFFEPGTLIDTDATLVGAGGVCKDHYFHTPFPQFITQQAHIIAHLELLAFILVLKAWPHLICNPKFVVRLDNMVAIPDLLSHWDLGDAVCQQFNVLNQDNHLTRTTIDAQWFQFIHEW